MSDKTIRYVRYVVIYQDKSREEFNIETKYAPLLNDLLNRIERLQKKGTAVYSTERDIYDNSD